MNGRLKKDYSNIFVSYDVYPTNCQFEDKVNLAHHAEITDSFIGKCTSVGRYSKIRNANIGRFCSISWDVTIGAVSHPLQALSTHAFSYRKKYGYVESDTYLDHATCAIGNDVWIGCNSVIMPRITVGNGAVIGSGAIVTHDVKPYEIVGGVPAKHIKYRFDEEIVQRLESIKWWDFDDCTINENIGLFKYNMPIQESTLSKLEEIRKNIEGKK